MLGIIIPLCGSFFSPQEELDDDELDDDELDEELELDEDEELEEPGSYDPSNPESAFKL